MAKPVFAGSGGYEEVCCNHQGPCGFPDHCGQVLSSLPRREERDGAGAVRPARRLAGCMPPASSKQRGQTPAAKQHRRRAIPTARCWDSRVPPSCPAEDLTKNLPLQIRSLQGARLGCGSCIPARSGVCRCCAHTRSSATPHPHPKSSFKTPTSSGVSADPALFGPDSLGVGQRARSPTAVCVPAGDG